MIKRNHVFIACSIIGLMILPRLVESPYAIHIMIMTAIYAALALSYNFSVGEVGTLSLAHPTFFGAGGYVAALLITKLSAEISLFLVVPIAGAVGGVLALIIGIPSFRLPERSFAIGTMAFAMIAHQVVHNWVSFTRGPMCVVPIPRPNLRLPFLMNWQPSNVRDYYYIVTIAFIIVFLFSSRFVSSRIGRAFNAVRESLTLATSIGINPLKYKMLAFVIGAIIAASLGVFYAHYLTIICPSDLSFTLLVNLLIIVFVGGVGSPRGMVLGAIVFALLPELLRLAPKYRMLIYGVTLLLSIIFLPKGLEGVINKVTIFIKERLTQYSHHQ